MKARNAGTQQPAPRPTTTRVMPNNRLATNVVFAWIVTLPATAILLLGTIVALSASAVLAQDRLTKDDLATLAATLGVYDSRCETLPPGVRADLQRMIRLLDKDDLMSRGLNEQEKVDQAGAATRSAR
jgi:hypothetical protein